MKGVKLDRDATKSFGPETISLVNATSAKTMRIAVNVYNDAAGGTPPNDGMCFGANPPYNYSGCHFKGGESVEFYNSAGLQASSVYPASTSRIWCVPSLLFTLRGVRVGLVRLP